MAVALQEAVKEHAAFYVPHLEVKVDGEVVPRYDVLQLVYQDSIWDLDRFELVINNCSGALKAPKFRYLRPDTSNAGGDGGADEKRLRFFEPSTKEVEVRMGYAGMQLRLMVTGNFTTLEPNFLSSGASTLVVRGLNALHQLRRKQYTTAWEEKKDSEIARNLATLSDLDTGSKRFPLPIMVDDGALSQEEPIPYVAQTNQYDIDFLFCRARERGYALFVVEGGKGRLRRQLYFGPSQSEVAGLRHEEFELEWGTSLSDFRPTLTTATQVKSVTVRGWSRTRKELIRETVTVDEQRVNINSDLRALMTTATEREEIVVDEPIFTTGQARQRALAILSERYKELVKATGTCFGLPDLRAGQRVRIRGVGARFSGTYFLTRTTHTISEAGYLTRFEARREDKSSGSGQ